MFVCLVYIVPNFLFCGAAIVVICEVQGDAEKRKEKSEVKNTKLRIHIYTANIVQCTIANKLPLSISFHLINIQRMAYTTYIQ